MQSSKLTSILIGLTTFSAVVSLALCWAMIPYGRKAGSLQAQVGGINQQRITLQAMGSELSEYAKRNPSMQPILDTVNAKFIAAAKEAAAKQSAAK
jgi:hypothetical protein